MSDVDVEARWVSSGLLNGPAVVLTRGPHQPVDRRACSPLQLTTPELGIPVNRRRLG